MDPAPFFNYIGGLKSAALHFPTVFEDRCRLRRDSSARMLLPDAHQTSTCCRIIPQWGSIDVIFIETSVFTLQIIRLISEDSYSELQQWIAGSPAKGDVIRGSGGCRKIRWMVPGKGKRGGIRVIYYWQRQSSQIVMLLAYAKSETEDLSREQIALLGEFIRNEFRSN